MHVKPDELVDIAEGTRAESSAPHLATCDDCRRQLADVRTMMSAAAEVEVPEPSPLFWDHFSARVRRAVASDGAPRRPWLDTLLAARRGARVWMTLSAVALAAMILAVVVNQRVPLPPVPSAPVVQVATTTTVGPVTGSAMELLNDVIPDDPSLTLVAQLTVDLDLDGAEEAGLMPRGSAEHAVSHMNDGELRELRRLLKEELARAGA